MTSINSGWRASTRPISVTVYEQPAGIPDYYPINDVSAFGPPVTTITGAIESVDGADYGIPGVTVNQWVARFDWSAAVTQYHFRVDGDPTFVQIDVSSVGAAVQFEAPAQSLVVQEDSSVTANLLTAVTVPSGETATLTTVGAASHGTVTVVGDDVTYVPAQNYTGPDQFTYTVTSSSGASRTATVSVTVTPVNDPPVAIDDTLTVNAGQSVEIDFGALVGNDTDTDGDPLSVTAISIVTPSIGGQLASCGTSRPSCGLYVAPAASGVENIDYIVSDGAGGVDAGRLRITVVPGALPDTLLVRLTCAGWSYTIGGPTSGLTVTPGPWGLTLLNGRARLGAANVRIGVVALRGGIASGVIQVSDPSVGLSTSLLTRNAALAIGSTWVMTGTWWRPIGGNVLQRCTFQVNVTDGG